MPSSPTRSTTAAPRRTSFGSALERAMADTATTQAALAAGIRRSQSTVSGWLSGTTTPGPATVFSVEALLGLDPGTLSRHLGFLPTDGVRGQVLTDLIRRDRSLTTTERRAVVQIYCSYADC